MKNYFKIFLTLSVRNALKFKNINKYSEFLVKSAKILKQISISSE